MGIPHISRGPLKKMLMKVILRLEGYMQGSYRFSFVQIGERAVEIMGPFSDTQDVFIASDDTTISKARMCESAEILGMFL